MSSNSTAQSSPPVSSAPAPTSSDATSQPASAQTTSSAAASSSPSPTSSATPTTTPQSSPVQTSSADENTSTSSRAVGASSSSALAASSTPSSALTSSSTFTSQVPTTIASTNPVGSVVYFTTTVPEVVSTAISSPSSNGRSSSHTGVIVGSVVGGVSGIALIALLLFCIRKRVRKDEFDGNFDPDRVLGHSDGGGTLPQVDLADEVSPYPQSYPDQANPGMRQYGGSPYLPVSSSLVASDQSNPELFIASGVGAGAHAIDAQSRQYVPADGYAPQVNMYGAGPADWHNPRPGVSPPASTVSNHTSSTRAAKEREAMARSIQAQGLALASQPEAAEGRGDVVVHQDGGRAPIEEPAPPREIPPAYDSIPQD